MAPQLSRISAERVQAEFEQALAKVDVTVRSPDGLVEAFSVAGAPGFTLAVQWHPEWRVAENPVSMKLFGAFGQACRDHYAARVRPL